MCPACLKRTRYKNINPAKPMIRIQIQPNNKKYMLNIHDDAAVQPAPADATYNVPTFDEAKALAVAFINGAVDPAPPAPGGPP
jgi:hypothetical protein